MLIISAMNIYAWIILTTLLVKYFIDVVSRWLNLRSLDPNIPDSFRDLYDPEKYALSQEYTRVTTRFHLVESTFQLILFLGFWFLNGFN